MAKNMHKFYITRSKFNKGAQIKNLFRKIDIDIPKDGFIFFLDEFKNLSEDGHIIDNISVDYSRILKYSITDYKELNLNSDYFDDYNKNQTDMLGGIELFIRKITKELESVRPRINAKGAISISPKASFLSTCSAGNIS